MAKKFILIDQSISSIAGHHYEYAVHVLEAAQRAGYEPLLATNLRFAKSTHHSPWRTFPIFHVGFWDSEGVAQSDLVNWILGKLGWLRFRWRMFYHYSLFGLLWAVRHRFTEFLLKQPLDRAHLASLATLVPAAVLLKLVRFIGLLLLLPLMLVVFLFRSAVRVLKAGGFPQSYVRELLSDVIDAVRLPVELWRRRIGYMKWWKQYQSLKSFQKDTARLLRELRPGAGDIVFVPTISAIDLMGLSELLKTERPGASWHLLFRRDIYPGRAAEYGLHEWRTGGLRNTLQVSMEKMRGHDVRFYTDTEELTAQYNRLGAAAFQTVPIPHTHTPVEAQPAGPLRIIYVGDARREKGYQYIPRIAEDLWNEYVAPGRVSFHLQSNFNVPNGEPEAVIARQQLEQLAVRKPGAIELIKRPLTSEQYKAFLLSGDINLLLYDADNYYARSSGILVESLSAGIPVIAPAGSWLARQFQGVVYAYQTGLRERMELVKTYEMGQLRWQVKNNPRANAITNGELTASSREAGAVTVLRNLPAVTHLLVDVDLGSVEAVVEYEQQDAQGNSIGGVQSRMLEGGQSCALVALDTRTVKLTVAVVRGSLRRLRLDLLRAKEALPVSAVGVVYHSVAEITPLVRDLIEHHEHYKRTAREFSLRWQEYHNSDQLITSLETKA